MKTRIIKNNGVFYPQYLKTWWFCKYKKWKYFYFEMDNIDASPLNVQNTFEVKHRFDTKLEAIHFIKQTVTYVGI